ncbi:MAG: DUF3098 domain-containing protein [Porphyromonas sp.]|nr:DUF3098 domain-containing protein [Porphyromonas sp.]
MNQKKYRPFLYGRTNLILLVISLLFVILGYILMAGGDSPDGVSFNPEVFSITRIRIAPTLCTIGYIGILVAILYRGNHE